MSVREEPLKFKLQRDDRPRGLTSYAGLPLLVETARALGVPSLVEKHLGKAVNSQAYSPWEVILESVSAIAVGAKSVEDVALLSRDGGFLELTEQSRLASKSTVLRFLYDAHELPTWQGGREGSAVVPPESKTLRGLAQVNQEVVEAVQERLQEPTATVDLDATIIESHKDETLAHYDGGRGYQPYVAVWAETGLVLADEFRDGNVGASTNARAQVKKAFGALPKGIRKKFFRADSALYDHKALRWLDKNGITFAVSADMSQELRKGIDALPENAWRPLSKRDELGELPTDCDIAEVEFCSNKSSQHKASRPYRYVVIRKRDKQGPLVRTAQGIFYLAVVTNEWKSSARDLWWWHREKCGTVELTHDVMKNDLAAGWMPCGRFQANAAWFRINILTYNLVIALKRLGLPREMQAMRPVTLRYRLLNLAGRIVQHARELILKLPWVGNILEVYQTCRKRIWAGTAQQPAGAT